MDLSTNYMGFTLANPLIPGASPLSDDLDAMRRLEDAGAPMLIMHSLFEEQISREEIALSSSLESPKDSFAEALSYFPEVDEFRLGPDSYLNQIRKLKAAVSIPVIASLNGVTVGGWIRYAKLIQEAGADGLELNLYEVAADLSEMSDHVERRLLDVVVSVREAISIPIAVKLSPFYSSLGHFVRQLDRIGVKGLVLFNRFYQPDLDIENLEITRVVRLSNSSELPLRLRWLAILFGNVKASLAVTGGVHSAVDVIKCMMAGASSCQMVSALLQRGPQHLKIVLDELRRWMEEHEYESIRQMQGSLSLQRVADPSAYERANYAKILQTWEKQTL